MADEHERHPADDLDGQARSATRIGNEADVHAVVEHRLMHAAGRFMTDPDGDAGKGLLEFVEQRRQAIQPDAGTCGNLERAGTCLDLIHLARQFVGQTDQLLAEGEAGLPGVVKPDPAEESFGQRLAEFRFHGVERLADMGRGAAMDAGGVGEALGESDVAENP